jgi:hypothetical protein
MEACTGLPDRAWNRIRRALALALALAAAGPLPAQDLAAKWKATPLVTLSTPLPDLPGASLTALGSCHLRPSGELVFWGKVSGREEPWAWCLFSHDGTRVRTILEGGEQAASRYATDPAARFPVRPGGGGLGVFNGRHLYLLVPGGGTFSPAWSVHTWDGEKLKPVLRPGDTLQVGGRPYTLTHADVRGVGPGGDPLLEFRAKVPDKLRAFALLDGDTVRPLDLAALGLKGGEVRSDFVFQAPPVAAGPELLAMVTGKGVPEGLYALGPGKARLLLAKGAPLPGYPQLKVENVKVLFTRSARRFVTEVACSDNVPRYFLHEGDRMVDLTPPEVRAWGDGSLFLQQGVLLDGEPPLLLYKAVAFKGKSTIKMEFNTWTENRQEAPQQVFCSNGTEIKRLTSWKFSAPRDGTQLLGFGGAATPGVLVRVDLSAFGPKAAAEFNGLQFWDRRDPLSGLKPLPELDVDPLGKVGLDKVVACPAPDTFLVSLPQGYFRLVRVAAGAASR